MIKDNIMNKAQDILYGAGIAEIGTFIFVHEDKMVYAGLSFLIAAGLIDRNRDRKDPNN